MGINIENSAEVITALRNALKSMEYDMYRNTRDDRDVIETHLEALECSVEREALYDDSRSHNPIDGMVKPEHVYCEYHEAYEESDE